MERRCLTTVRPRSRQRGVRVVDGFNGSDPMVGRSCYQQVRLVAFLEIVRWQYVVKLGTAVWVHTLDPTGSFSSDTCVIMPTVTAPLDGSIEKSCASSVLFSS